MPTVVAVFSPKPGHSQDVLDAFAVASPLVHEEPGCELYAVYTDGDNVVIVERWTTAEDLAVHSEAQPLADFGAAVADVLSKPFEVYVLENFPLGDPLKGTIQ